MACPSGYQWQVQSNMNAGGYCLPVSSGANLSWQQDAANEQAYREQAKLCLADGYQWTWGGTNASGFFASGYCNRPPPPAPTTRAPTPAPTKAPTPAPTKAPTPAPTTRAPTPAPTQTPTSAAPITPAPTTRAPTPSPTPAPMPPPSYLRYPSNLVVFAHEGEWMNKGILKVLTLRGSTPSLQNFVYKDMTQVFAIDSRGSVRCVADQGTYVKPASTCDGVVGGPSASEWRFVNRDLPRSYSVEVKCAVGTRRLEFSNMVHPWAILLGGTAGSSVGWFVVPVARTESAETTPSIGQTGRTEWPELQGTNAETAHRGLAAARPDLMVSVIGTNSAVTMDWRENRVRIRAGANGIVESVPRIG